MTKRKYIRGSLTIEAAIILPIFLLVVLAISFFIRVVNIQETVHYSMAEAASILADSAYIVTKTGIIEIQQTGYETFQTREATYEENQMLIMSQLNNLTAEPEIELPEIPTVTFDVGGSNIIEFASNWLSEVDQFRGEFLSFFDAIIAFGEAIYENMSFVLEDITLLFSDQNQSEYISVANGYLAGNIAKLIMSSYISNEDLEALGLIDGYNGMDASKSSYLLDGEDIIIAVSYQVRIPFFPDILPDFTMTDSIRVKAFIGNQNYKTSYITSQSEDDSNEDDEMSQIVYVTENGARYHIDANCFHIHIEAKAILYTDILEPIDFCETCSANSGSISQYTYLYKTDGDSKYHIDPNCSRIIRNPVGLSKEDAIRQGYTACLDCSRGE